MAVPESPRPRQAATSRALGRAAPGLLGGTVPGLSPTRRGPQGAVRREASSGLQWAYAAGSEFWQAVWSTPGPTITPGASYSIVTIASSDPAEEYVAVSGGSVTILKEGLYAVGLYVRGNAVLGASGYVKVNWFDDWSPAVPYSDSGFGVWRLEQTRVLPLKVGDTISSIEVLNRTSGNIVLNANPSVTLSPVLFV